MKWQSVDSNGRPKFIGVLFSFGGRFDYLTIALHGSLAVVSDPILKRMSPRPGGEELARRAFNFQLPRGIAPRVAKR